MQQEVLCICCVYIYAVHVRMVPMECRNMKRRFCASLLCILQCQEGWLYKLISTLCTVHAILNHSAFVHFPLTMFSNSAFCSHDITYLLTYLLTPWSRILLEKLTGFQLVKKFSVFYGTRRFITAFTSVQHLSLSWANSIQSMPPHATAWRSFLILSSHLRLGLPSGFFLSRFPIKTLHMPLLSHIRATCRTHLILQSWHYIQECNYSIKIQFRIIFMIQFKHKHKKVKHLNNHSQ